LHSDPSAAVAAVDVVAAAAAVECEVDLSEQVPWVSARRDGVVRASPLSLNRHSGADFECQPLDVSHSYPFSLSTPSRTAFGNFAF